MRIGIDTRFAVRNRRGIGNYTLNLVQNLSRIDLKNEYILYTDRDDGDRVLPQKNNFRIKKISPLNYFIWEQIMLPLQAKRDGVDILHCTGNTAPILLNKKIKLLATIHDVMYLKDYSDLPRSSSWYQRAGRLYRKAIVPIISRNLSMVLTVSDFSRNDIQHHLPNLKNECITVTHEAANGSYHRVDKKAALQTVNQKFGIEGTYILTLGALDPRKNTELVIEKFIELKKENHIEAKLVIVGVPHWQQTKFYHIIQRSNLSADIIFTPFISEDDLVLLYNGATLFLYPSLYEGFGIPPLEAMACGTPVITSNTTSLPEVVADAAFLIDPRDGEELKQALQKLLIDEHLRNALITRGLEQVKKFSWLKMAAGTLQAYELVYGTGNGEKTTPR